MINRNCCGDVNCGDSARFRKSSQAIDNTCGIARNPQMRNCGIMPAKSLKSFNRAAVLKSPYYYVIGRLVTASLSVIVAGRQVPA